MRFHVLTGVPRSGSSLLCNILRQNPLFCVSPTSELAGMLGVLRTYLSQAPETKSELICDPERTFARICRQYLALIRTHYYDVGPNRVIVDKSRAWLYNVQLLQKILPHAKLVVTVCDLRASFASVERQHDRTAVLDAHENPLARTIDGRAAELLGDTGVIGLPARGVEDLLRRRPSNALVLRMEQFLADPAGGLDMLYQFFELPRFDHDLADVKNTNREVDGIWNYKFPHRGEGAVRDQLPDWHSWVPDEIGAEILRRFPLYHQELGYTDSDG